MNLLRNNNTIGANNNYNNLFPNSYANINNLNINNNNILGRSIANIPFQRNTTVQNLNKSFIADETFQRNTVINKKMIKKYNNNIDISQAVHNYNDNKIKHIKSITPINEMKKSGFFRKKQN